MMEDKICLQGFVSGHVQGVGFRQATQKQAQQLGVTGWVRNVSDGRVRFCICGNREQVKILSSWLEQGPPVAKVTHIESKECAWKSYPGFHIL